MLRLGFALIVRHLRHRRELRRSGLCYHVSCCPTRHNNSCSLRNLLCLLFLAKCIYFFIRSFYCSCNSYFGSNSDCINKRLGFGKVICYMIRWTTNEKLEVGKKTVVVMHWLVMVWAFWLLLRNSPTREMKPGIFSETTRPRFPCSKVYSGFPVHTSDVLFDICWKK